MSKCTRVIAIFLLLACLSQPVAWAQQAQEGPGIENFLDGANGGRGPVMQSVFWNTLYGSNSAFEDYYDQFSGPWPENSMKR